MPYELVPSGTRIDFIGKRRICAALSIALLAASAAAIPLRGIRLGIDFAGGTEVQVLFGPGVAVDEGAVRSVVTACGVEDPSVIRYGEGESEYLIRFGSASQEALDAALSSGGCSLTDADRATLAAARELHSGRLVVAFQPHRYTRTRDLWNDFVTAFNHADVLLVTEVYAGLRQARITTEFATVGTFEMGTDGTVVWETNPFAGITIRQGWDACQYMRDFGLAQHVDWREMYAKARYVGITDLDGVRCHELQLFPKMLVKASAKVGKVAQREDLGKNATAGNFQCTEAKAWTSSPSWK